MEARVTVAGMGLVMEVQDYFDGEADRLAKAWLAEYTPQIKSLKDERKEAYRQIVEMSTEPQDVDLVRPANKFEMTRVREGERKLTFQSGNTICCVTKAGTIRLC